MHLDILFGEQPPLTNVLFKKTEACQFKISPIIDIYLGEEN